MAWRVGSGWRDAHGSGAGRVAARAVSRDARRGQTGRLHRVCDDATAPVRARGRGAFLTRALHIHRALARSPREEVFMNRRLRLDVLVCLVLASTSLMDAQGPPAAPSGPSPEMVMPGELLIEPPTLINLGFEWFIQGDANRNASVQVSFRKAGTSEWKPALPLLRLNGERIYAESRVDVIAPNMFAGSILDLEPDASYEARF